MFTLFIVLHVIFCIFLILVILLQTGKGAGIGAAFGGGSQTVFGPRGAGSFIGKVTGTVASLFMITSIVLAYLSTSGSAGVEERAQSLAEERAKAVENVDLGEPEPAVATPTEKPAPDAGTGAKADSADTAASSTDSSDAKKEEKPAEEEKAAKDEPKAQKLVPPGLEKAQKKPAAKKAAATKAPKAAAEKAKEPAAEKAAAPEKASPAKPKVAEEKPAAAPAPEEKTAE